MSKDMYKDADFLTFLYHTLEYSIRDIARVSGYSRQSILNWFKELEIPTRTQLESMHTKRTRAKVSKPRKKGLIQTEEHRRNSGVGVKKQRKRKRAEGNHFHRESLPSIEEI